MANIYVYVDGSDLGEVEVALLRQFENFAKEWGIDTARVINDKKPRTPDLKPEDLPDWNLGLNLEVEHLSENKIEQLIGFLSEISSKTQREFVIGGWNTITMISEDWCFVGESPRSSCIKFLKEMLQ